MRKASILMVMSTYHGIGGHDIVINNLSNGLTKLGYDVHIGAFSFKQNPPDDIPMVKLTKTSLAQNTIDGKNFDIIHSHETSMNYYSLFNKKPTVFHYHGANGTLQKMNLRMSMFLCRNTISKIIPVSFTALDHLKNMLGTIPAEVIYNGVDTKFYNIDLPRPHTKGDPQLLFVGNLYPHKNVMTLLDAMYSILVSYPFAHLQIVGDGGDYTRLSNKIKEKKLEKNVELVGKLYKDELRLRYSSCDIYVSASKLEANPVPVLEAMSCGKPVVLSEIPAHKELVNASNGGLTFSSFDSIEIKNKLQEVYEKRKHFGSAAREFAEKYDWSSVCKQVAAIYDQIV